MLAEIALLAMTQFVESIEVRVTSIDVVVTDRAGKPVTGLTKDDFELYENGRKQTITNFYAVERTAVEPQIAAEPKAAVPAEAVPPEVQRRRVVFFIDEDSLGPMQRNKLLRVLDAEIARLVRDGDVGSAVFWNRRGVQIEPFTTDAAALQRSLRARMDQGGNLSNTAGRDLVRMQVEALAGDARRNRRTAQSYYTECRSIVSTWAQDVIRQQSRLLSGLSATLARLGGIDGKKVVIFATGSLSIQVGTDLFAYVDQLFRDLVMIRDVVQLEGAARSMQPQIEKLARQAATNGVTMYMIDASGTVEGATSFDEAQIEGLKRWNTAVALQSIAAMTGGVALTNSENFQHVVDTIATDLDTWYSLGYRPQGSDTRRRNVEVKVLRPGLRVRSRQSWAPKTAVEQMQDRVIASVFHDDVRGEMPVQIALRSKPQRTDRSSFTLSVRVTIPSTITLLPDGDALAGGFSVYVVVGSRTGDLSNVTKMDHPIRIKPAEEKALRAQPFTYDFDLVVRAGEQTLSVAVVDQLTNQTGIARTTIVAR